MNRKTFLIVNVFNLIAPIAVETLRAWAVYKSRRLQRKAGKTFIEMPKPFASNYK
jgi:hypothetical protein